MSPVAGSGGSNPRALLALSHATDERRGAKRDDEDEHEHRERCRLDAECRQHRARERFDEPKTDDAVSDPEARHGVRREKRDGHPREQDGHCRVNEERRVGDVHRHVKPEETERLKRPDRERHDRRRSAELATSVEAAVAEAS